LGWSDRSWSTNSCLSGERPCAESSG
jgi:hypothetical protein